MREILYESREIFRSRKFICPLTDTYSLVRTAEAAKNGKALYVLVLWIKVISPKKSQRRKRKKSRVTEIICKFEYILSERYFLRV